MSEQDRYRLSVRFGEEILARGHTAIPNLVLNYYVRLGLSGPELLFTIHVWQHWWSDRDPYPSLRTIATRMGISVRQAKRYVESLESKGFLRVIERFLPDGSQTTNEFDYSPLIRAVVDAARADGALEPGGGEPAIRRRTRTRATPGDIPDTPPRDVPVTPGDGPAVTPTVPMAGTGPRSSASPKEDVVHADLIHADREGATSNEELAELLELFSAATGRATTESERAELGTLLAEYAPAAARALPPASAAEWVAAALLEGMQERGPALPLTALRPTLDRYAGLQAETAPTPAPATKPRRSEPRRMPAAGAAPAGGDRRKGEPPALAGVWQVALDDLREQMVPANFARWLARSSLVRRAAGQAVVGVPDQVSADQLARRFDQLVCRALSDACGEPVTVRYEVVS